MSSLFARFIGLAPGQQIAPDAAIVLVERRSSLSRSEARVLVLDYLGVSRDELSDHLGVSIETVRTYWKRIYRKTGCRSREAARAWFERLLHAEINQ
jgi:DNA-binding CsgD family transcriptional regulator